MKGFPSHFVDLVMMTVRGGSVGINVNDVIGNYFKTKKGLRQGDPLSPLLFNIVADVLNTLVKRAQHNGLLTRAGWSFSGRWFGYAAICRRYHFPF